LKLPLNIFRTIKLRELKRERQTIHILRTIFELLTAVYGHAAA
jgi:hypothetical protein